MKKNLVASLFAALIISLVGGSGCFAPIDPCPGQEACGNGCMPAGAECCGSSGYCDPGFFCGPGATCISTYNPTTGCISQGMQPCPNLDGTIGCAPLGSTCCGNGRYCPSGFLCGGSCGYECCG